ncbi:MAG: manganese efflux pump [Bacteroidota bacterium]
MEILYVILITLPIALVAFSAAFWGGVYRCLCLSEKLKMAASFAIFQTGFFYLGMWSGNSFANSLGWLAIPFAEAIIMLTGIKLIYGAFKTRPEQKSYNLASNSELIAVSFAAGLNAFMIGLGIGLLRPINVNLLYFIPVLVVLLAYIGDYLGKQNGRIIYTTFAGLVAGLSLLALGTVFALVLQEII